MLPSRRFPPLAALLWNIFAMAVADSYLAQSALASEPVPALPAPPKTRLETWFHENAHSSPPLAAGFFTFDK